MKPPAWSSLAVVALLVVHIMVPPAGAQQQVGSRAAGGAPLLLLYYDDGPLGELYAKALHSWLGHFRLTVVRSPVERYRQGDLRDASFVAYIGARHDNPSLPSPFLDDVADTSLPVLWVNYNVWQLVWRAGESRLGLAYESIDDRGEHDAVSYKGVLLPRDPRADLVRVRPVAPWMRVHAMATGKAGQESPYVLWGRNFLYVADAVFNFLSDGDRSLVLADILHDFLEQPHEEARHALVRIEDVHPLEEVSQLRWINAYLISERVPYSIALIPVHVDKGKRVTRLSDEVSSPMVRTLRGVVGWRVRLMLHGYTHQYDGFTPRDWEFWDEQRGRPLNDSAEWAADRVRRGMDELAAVNLRAHGWVTPHYMASEEHYRAFARLFKVAYERQFFFDNQVGGLLLFYPYPVVDLFGRLMIPETLGSPVTTGSVQEMLRTAERLKVVRCGVASAYIHLDQDRQVYRDLISGLKRLGYRFVGVGIDSPFWRSLQRP